MLSNEECSFCDLGKEIVDRLAAEFPLEVATLHFESEKGETLAMAHGALFPPVVFIDGEFFCYGRFSERRLRKELERRLAQERP